MEETKKINFMDDLDRAEAESYKQVFGIFDTEIGNYVKIETNDESAEPIKVNDVSSIVF